jgi:uncharacterized damage-inducible protein DinB
MTGPGVLKSFYDGWAGQHGRLIDSIRPLTPEQMQLCAAPSQWAIWQLASNMAGGRLYWFCWMLREDDHGLLPVMFSVDDTSPGAPSINWSGWEADEANPRTADELVDVLEGTWRVVEACLGRWSLEDLSKDVTNKDGWGQVRTITPAWVIQHLMLHEVGHGSEIALILRVHGLPTAMGW